MQTGLHKGMAVLLRFQQGMRIVLDLEDRPFKLHAGKERVYILSCPEVFYEAQ